MSSLSLPNNDYDTKVGDPIVGQEVVDDFSAIVTWANGNIDPTNFSLPFTAGVTWSTGAAITAISIVSAGTVADVKVARSGILAASQASFKVTSTGIETLGDGLYFAELTSASSTIPAFQAKAASTSPLYQGQQDGSGPFLYFKDAVDDFFKLREAAGQVIYETFNADSHRFDVNGDETVTIGQSFLRISEPGGDSGQFEALSGSADRLVLKNELQFEDSSGGILSKDSTDGIRVRNFIRFESASGPIVGRGVDDFSIIIGTTAGRLQFGTAGAQLRSTAAPHILVNNAGGTHQGNVVISEKDDSTVTKRNLHGRHVAAGTAAAGGGTLAGSVSFPAGNTYGATPSVTVTCEPANCHVSAIPSTTGFTFLIRNEGGVGQSSPPINWIALGNI